MTDRAPRLAFMLLPGLDHFAHDLIARLPASGTLEVKEFHFRGPADLDAACAWANDAACDAIWFEFCWPPFPALIARYDFGGRRVVMRVHRIEAYETPHAATAPWSKIDDVIVVSADMAARLLAQVPGLPQSTRLHVVHNGVDVERFVAGAWDAYRIGWCGLLNMRKNPVMALQILHLLREADRRWHLHVCAKGGDPVALDSFNFLARRLGLTDAITMDGNIAAADMPAWHARNFLLLSTSLHESFGYAIAEAASCGCDVAMLDHLGAAEFWPDEIRFGTAAEAAGMIKAARPGKWRELILQRFSLDLQLEKLRRILRPIGADAEIPRIGIADELLDHLASGPRAIRLDLREQDEMEAAEFLLDSMGYKRAGQSPGGVLFRACHWKPPALP
jgi:glycosyltransferase involved in cell wall biosynthesis